MLLSAIFLMAACGGQDQSSDGNDKGSEGGEKEKKENSELTLRGEEFDTKGAMAAEKLPEKMEGEDSLQVKLKGDVKKVCQKKGCWLELDMGSDHPRMMVRFKDYSFFVPKDASGSKATIKGWAYRDTLSVKQLRHYAKDKGKDQAAIDSIQEPQARLAFKASGVVLQEGKKQKE